MYALIYTGIDHIGFLPLTSFPFPYKYLIAVGFYFYIKRQLAPDHQTISKIDYLLFVPALLYGLLRAYWYYRIHIGQDDDLFYRIYQTGFFVYNDFVYLIFSLLLMVSVIRFVKKRRGQIKGSISKLKNWDWLAKFSWAYLTIVILNLLHLIISIIFNLQDSAEYYSAILILNTIYIYWIGFVSFRKSKLLFNTYQLKDIESIENPIQKRLEHLIDHDEIYTNKNLKVSDLATALDVSEKELSTFIHETYQMSFSDYLNIHRVEKVKSLLASSEQNKYTLVAISEQAGFRSKSSFYAVFKNVTGITPAQYKKTLED